MALTQITITGTPTPQPGQATVTGTITFQLVAPVTNSSNVVLVPAAEVITTLVAGSIPANFKLWATDDTGSLPAGNAYQVTEWFDGLEPRTYTMAVSATGSNPLDLSTVAPVSPNITYTLTATATAVTTTTNRPTNTDINLQAVTTRLDAMMARALNPAMFGAARQALQAAMMASGRKNFYLVGDSIGDDFFASSTDQGLMSVFMADVLHGLGQRYPTGGGYMPISSTTACGYTGRMTTPVANGQQGQTGDSPAWTDRTDRGLGYGVALLPYNGGTNNQYQTPNFVSDRPGLAYSDGPILNQGTAKLYRASDNALITTLTIPTSNAVSLSTRLLDGGAQLRDTYYWLVRTNNTFGTIVDGPVAFDGNYATGVAFWRGCHYGYKLENLNVDGATNGWVTAFDPGGSNPGPGAPACVIVELPTNNDRAGDTVAQIRTKFNTLVTYVNAKTDALSQKRTTFVIIPSFNTTSTPGEISNGTYAAWQCWADNPNQVIVLDQSALWGYVGTGGGGDPFGFTADNVHPTTNGAKWGHVLAAAFLNLLGMQVDPTNASTILTGAPRFSGPITMESQTTPPAAPASGLALLYPEKPFGRELYLERGAAGLGAPLGIADWHRSFVAFRPTTGAGFGNWGSITNNGTASTPAFTEARGPKTLLTGSGGANALSGIQSTNTEFLRGSATSNPLGPSGASSWPNLFNGFLLIARAYWADASYNNAGAGTGCRNFVGFTDQSATTATGADNPAGSRIGFSRCHVNGGLTDANWFISAKDGATENRVDTGMAFTAQHQYVFAIHCPGGGSTITWRVDDITAGTSATGTTTSNIPAGATLLRAMCELQTVDAAVRTLEVNEFYAEACR